MLHEKTFNQKITEIVTDIARVESEAKSDIEQIFSHKLDKSAFENNEGEVYKDRVVNDIHVIPNQTTGKLEIHYTYTEPVTGGQTKRVVEVSSPNNSVIITIDGDQAYIVSAPSIEIEEVQERMSAAEERIETIEDTLGEAQEHINTAQEAIETIENTQGNKANKIVTPSESATIQIKNWNADDTITDIVFDTSQSVTVSDYANSGKITFTNGELRLGYDPATGTYLILYYSVTGTENVTEIWHENNGWVLETISINDTVVSNTTNPTSTNIWDLGGIVKTIPETIEDLIDVKNALKTEINGVETAFGTNLETQINSLETNLEAQISSLETNLETQIGNIETEKQNIAPVDGLLYGLKDGGLEEIRSDLFGKVDSVDETAPNVAGNVQLNAAHKIFLPDNTNGIWTVNPGDEVSTILFNTASTPSTVITEEKIEFEYTDGTKIWLLSKTDGSFVFDDGVSQTLIWSAALGWQFHIFNINATVVSKTTMSADVWNDIMLTTSLDLIDVHNQALQKSNADFGVMTSVIPEKKYDTTVLRENYKNPATGIEGTNTRYIPLADTQNSGLMPKTAVTSLTQALADIAILKGVGRILGQLGENPTQEELSELWKSVKATNVVPEGATIVNSDQEAPLGHTWTFFDTLGGGQWHDRGLDTVNFATNTIPGIVQGTEANSTTDGKVRVETDGTMAVNGWEAAIQNPTLENIAIDSADYDGTPVSNSLNSLLVGLASKIRGLFSFFVDGVANIAAKLQTARTIQTDLSSTTAAAFDGTANVMPGIAGTLPLANGGTGRSDGKSPALVTSRTIQTNLASTTAAAFDGTANVTPGITGTLPIANGGTGNTSIASFIVNQLTNGTSSSFTGYYTNIFDSNGNSRFRVTQGDFFGSAKSSWEDTNKVGISINTARFGGQLTGRNNMLTNAGDGVCLSYTLGEGGGLYLGLGFNVEWSPVNSNAFKYYVDEDIPASYISYINATGSLVLNSDRRLKKDIKDFDKSSLALICKLRVVSFRWRTDELTKKLRKAEESNDTKKYNRIQKKIERKEKKHIGFIAQEVREVIPDAIFEADTGYLGMSKEELIPYLVGAIQELQVQINVLKTALETK
jgi:hypothetical protein